LYVTGSNAYLLSSELATLLTGRAFEINILPFSFAEYLEFTGKTANPDRAFSEYMRIGGFPEAIGLAKAGKILSRGFRLEVCVAWQRTYGRCRAFARKCHFSRIETSKFTDLDRKNR